MALLQDAPPRCSSKMALLLSASRLSGRSIQLQIEWPALQFQIEEEEQRRLECLQPKESLAEAALKIDNNDDCDDNGHDDNHHYHDEEDDDMPETFTDGNRQAEHISVERLCHIDKISVIKP